MTVSTPARLFIFGWDCADWAVIHEGWRRGMLPHLRALCDRGESGTLMSTIPPVTAPAWTSFLTGKDPGEHGIFGFRTVDPVDYRSITVPGGQRRGSTLIKRADEAGYRTCLVTVPWTYPPEPVAKGAIVPGWDAPDESVEGCYPPEVGDELAAIVGRVPRRPPDGSGAQRFLASQRQNIDLRERICNHLIARTHPDIFMTVFSEPDQATHRFWGSSRIPQTLLSSYAAVDEAMGRMMSEHVGPDDRVLVLSDHGALPVHTYVHVGKVLADAGFLSMTAHVGRKVMAARTMKRRIWYRVPPRFRNTLQRVIPKSARESASRTVRGTRVDWSKTRAFPRNDEAAGIGVDINVQPPYQSGPVSIDEYESVRQDVMECLSSVTDFELGQPVFDQVLPKEELYEGPELDSAPDIVLVPAPGFGTSRGMDLTGRMSRVAVGGHRREGIFVTSWGLGLGSVADIRDLLPRALESCGFEVSPPAAGQQDEDIEGYTEVEAKEMEIRLRELGYVE